MGNNDFKKDKWYNIVCTYDGNSDPSNIVLNYSKKIDGVDYQIQEQNGKIISKIPLKNITY